MTNFSDFNVQQDDFAALQSVWYTINGIYVWEYVTTFDFELDMMQGRRSYRWTIWIYSLARGALLISIILNLVDLDDTTQLNCQALVTIQLAFCYVSLVNASLLIMIRIIAIWDKNKLVVAMAAITWVTNVSFVIQGVARLRAMWVPALQTCTILNSEEIKPTLVITLVTDIILLFTMLFGLFRLHTDNGCEFGLGRLLWKQGIIWLLAATTAGVPPTVFIFLNLNVPFNIMFQLPAVITNTIAATRMYRSLADYTFGSTDISLNISSSKADTKVSKMKCDNRAPTSLNRIEVAVDTPTSDIRHHRQHSAWEHSSDKPQLSTSSDVENAVEIGIAK